MAIHFRAKRKSGMDCAMSQEGDRTKAPPTAFGEIAYAHGVCLARECSNRRQYQHSVASVGLQGQLELPLIERMS